MISLNQKTLIQALIMRGAPWFMLANLGAFPA